MSGHQARHNRRMTDPLLAALDGRLADAVARAASAGDPMLGTVELTISELAELLYRHRRELT